jgi:hypothetical protein
METYTIERDKMDKLPINDVLTNEERLEQIKMGNRYYSYSSPETALLHIFCLCCGQRVGGHWVELLKLTDIKANECHNPECERIFRFHNKE